MKKNILSFVAVAALSGGVAANASAEEVKVKDGDTLWGISKQKEVSVEDLKHLNNLSGEVIHPGDTLQVSLHENYKVQNGDSLWGIAKEYNVSIEDLKGWNGLDSHTIQPDQNLIIKHKQEQTKNTFQAEPIEQQTNQAEPVKAAPAGADPVAASPAESSDGKEISVTATAYTANCEGCSGTTSTGIDLKANPNQKVIAVDPNVIPLGSKVHVEGYGEAIAGDTGGAIKGNKIDVFISSESEAQQWGTKEVKVKVLE
ncbi:LysM peptidoglycan-binding domain-containing protein [Metabacillus arenae]|uniref:LysM peptidoglycan-binding domain-containing protein n=1 Tax=Metabacillus arenae TaxID=2771434 RepID=A0A926RW99_9BACI|nr:3D domain-containing protein [Metabacillus arenae]MBD1378962.1 LysM peptidoglycan-binding domain-containing protein [Metabacillus arenae]